jgi:hypothetical protein
MRKKPLKYSSFLKRLQSYWRDWMRPIYETEEDLQKEERLALAFAQKYGAEAHKLPALYPLDYSYTKDGSVVAFMEIKIRTNSFAAYQTYMISLSKITSARNIHITTGLPVLLAVKWGCGTVGFIDVNAPFENLTMGGRTDRNDEADIEPVVHWNMEAFTIVHQA